MKEYVILEKSKFNEMSPNPTVAILDNKNPLKSDITRKWSRENDIDSILNRYSTQPDILLKLYNHMKTLYSSKEDSSSDIETTKQETSNFTTDYIQLLPNYMQNASRILLDYLISNNIITVSKSGIAYDKNRRSSLRIEDLLRTLISKNASIIQTKPFINNILDQIPEDLVFNKKVKVLLETGGMIKPRVTARSKKTKTIYTNVKPKSNRFNWKF